MSSASGLCRSSHAARQVWLAMFWEPGHAIPAWVAPTAAAVLSGRADCGLGIAAAAQALDLDFIPLFQERYDLVIPKEHAQSDLLSPVFELLAGRGFRDSVSKLTGYDITVMGRIILEDEYG